MVAGALGCVVISAGDVVTCVAISVVVVAGTVVVSGGTLECASSAVVVAVVAAVVVAVVVSSGRSTGTTLSNMKNNPAKVTHIAAAVLAKTINFLLRRTKAGLCDLAASPLVALVWAASSIRSLADESGA